MTFNADAYLENTRDNAIWRATTLHFSLRSRLLNAEEALDSIKTAPVHVNRYRTHESLVREVDRLREQLYSWQRLAAAVLAQNELEEQTCRP